MDIAVDFSYVIMAFLLIDGGRDPRDPQTNSHDNPRQDPRSQNENHHNRCSGQKNSPAKCQLEGWGGGGRRGWVQNLWHGHPTQRTACCLHGDAGCSKLCCGSLSGPSICKGLSVANLTSVLRSSDREASWWTFRTLFVFLFGVGQR